MLLVCAVLCPMGCRQEKNRPQSCDLGPIGLFGMVGLATHYWSCPVNAERTLPIGGTDAVDRF